MIRIVPVNYKGAESLFLRLPRILYKEDPNYVHLFDHEIRKAFDRKVNPYFKHGDAVRWIALDENKKVVGRIAAFYDRDRDASEELKNGGCGFFESVNDPAVANLLFDTAKSWLAEHGYESMTGPTNFGENDTNWGCLVHGFSQPVLGMTYNPPYYRELFEDYGFRLYYRQLSFQIDLDKPFPERFWKIAEWINKRKGYSYKHYDPELSAQFVEDTIAIYNEAWRPLRKDFTPMDPGSLHDELRKIKDIMDPELIWFAYYEGKPISFFMFLPDANQIFKHLNGKLHLLNKVRFLYYKRKKIINSFRGTAAGVVPKFQNSGVESGIIWQLNEVVKNKPQYKHLELAWVGDFNPKMIDLYLNTGARHSKTHITYRYLFDREKVFKRFMGEVLEEEKLPPEALTFN